MLPFIKAEQLKKRYDVRGCFYHLLLDNNKVLPCRNVLEIYHRDKYEARSGSDERPDALVIMTNPGSSRPLAEDFVPPKVKSRNLNLIISKETLVAAKPDNAQYQIMRLMDYKQWGHVRIINLSDIREPNSRKFAALIQTPALARQSVHSIFSEKRTNERHSALQRKPEAPIIAAWGQDAFLQPLAEKCLASLPERPTGVECQHHPSLFAHACPTLQIHKERWLNAIVDKLG